MVDWERLVTLIESVMLKFFLLQAHVLVQRIASLLLCHTSTGKTFYCDQIIIATRIDYKIATNERNLMFFVPLKSRESELFANGLIANFKQIHGKLQWNRMGICILIDSMCF